jgi:hypothetical protein
MTVGYGDIYPITKGGRFVSILSSVGGLFLTASLIGVINNGLELNKKERNIVDWIDR